MSSKLKNILFHFFGISLFVFGFVLSIWFGTFSKEKDLIWLAVVIIFFMIFNLIMGTFTIFFDYQKTIFNYVWNFKSLMNIKWVCHSELGYFPTIIGKNKLIIYKQNIFSINKLTSISTDNSSIEHISNMIRGQLDLLYEIHLQDVKESEVIEVKNNEIRKWDGFLDVPTRRDKKIDKLLK